MKSGAKALAVVGAILLGGCAAAPASLASRPTASPAPRIKLAVLAVESDALPQIAAALNGALGAVKLAGVDDYFVSKVSLEVVQLSIECVQAAPSCYAGVGHSLGANRLLFATIAPKRSRRDRVVRVHVVLFDVDAAATLRAIDRSFPSRSEAIAGAAALVGEAIDLGAQPGPGEGSAGREGA